VMGARSLLGHHLCGWPLVLVLAVIVVESGPESFSSY